MVPRSLGLEVSRDLVREDPQVGVHFRGGGQVEVLFPDAGVIFRDDGPHLVRVVRERPPRSFLDVGESGPGAGEEILQPADGVLRPVVPRKVSWGGGKGVIVIPHVQTRLLDVVIRKRTEFARGVAGVERAISSPADQPLNVRVPAFQGGDLIQVRLQRRSRPDEGNDPRDQPQITRDAGSFRLLISEKGLSGVGDSLLPIAQGNEWVQVLDPVLTNFRAEPFGLGHPLGAAERPAFRGGAACEREADRDVGRDELPRPARDRILCSSDDPPSSLPESLDDFCPTGCVDKSMRKDDGLFTFVERAVDPVDPGGAPTSGVVESIEVGMTILLNLGEPHTHQEVIPLQLEPIHQGKVGIGGRTVPGVLGHVKVATQEKRDAVVKGF